YVVPTGRVIVPAGRYIVHTGSVVVATGRYIVLGGLQVKQKQDGIFISQDKYVAEILWKFRLTDGKLASTPIDTEKPLLKDPDVAYSDSDYAGASLDRKSTTRGCQFLGCILISSQCKKQTVVATSSTKAEYVAAASCCAQVLWIQNQLLDYGSPTYSDSDYAGASLDKKSTTGGCQFLGCSSISSQCKKQTVVATSSTEAEYVAAASCCAQDTVREALRLDDAESINCLPNEEIFTELARMGYEKPSTKLTFYKAYFLAQWKFLIHTILQCMSAKRTAWNEFSSAMASVVICLSTGMLVQQQAAVDVNDEIADSVPTDDVSNDVPITDAEPTPPSLPPTTTPPPSQELPSTSQEAREEKEVDSDWVEKIKEDANKDVTLEEVKVEKNADVQGRQEESQAEAYHIDLEHVDKVLSMHDDEPESAELQEVVTTAKLMTKVVTAATTTITAAPSAARSRKGVVIRDPEETATPSTIIHSKPKSKDKGKGIMDDVIKHVKEKGKQENAVLRYQALKRKPYTEAQARKNMMVYLKNMTGFKMDYFKGMSYDDIRPIFKKYFKSNVAFLEKSKEELEEEESRALKRKTKSSDEKAVKKQKLD
nr:copia protein [Tanacetum cinerariifolium]